MDVLEGQKDRGLPPTPRQRERRQGIAELLAALTRGLDRKADVSSNRGVFEQMLSRIVPLRSARLLDRPPGWTGSERESGTDSIALDVPGGDPASPSFLQATFDPGCPLCEWDLQILNMATHIGAFVLEVERGSIGKAPAAQPRPPRRWRDGAAPLIGSTPAMQALRAMIERVAGTDFTVLLEGESGVGKELVARQIHDLGRRKNGPFVAINCAALV